MSQQIATFKQILICLVVFLTFHWVARNGYDTFAHTIAHLGFFLLALCFSWQISKVITFMETRVNSNDKAVLITGCDTGFGNVLAKQLSNLGYQVFAGVLFADGESAQSLAQYGPNLHVVQMDVIDNDQIKLAREYVEQHLDPGRRLWAIVNNAGLGGFGSLEWGSENLKEDYLNIFDVNTFGVVRVTRTFLPLLRRTKDSRVVIVGSMSGEHTMPGITPYSMSKHAVRAFGDGLRREVSHFGINVSIIEPSFYSTGMTDPKFISQTIKSMWDKTPAHLREELGDKTLKSYLAYSQSLKYLTRTNIQEVIDALLSSVTSKNPRLYYIVCGFRDKISLHLFSLLPVEIQDICILCLKLILKLVQNKS